MKVELQRVDQAFHFEATGAEGVKVHIDGSKSIGASGEGARPMELILMGLGGCSAIDVISILRKQKQEISDVRIVVDGDRVEEIPAVFSKIRMHFEIDGQLDRNKVERAIRLSVEKYCSVYAMLVKTAEITYSFTVNGE